MKILIIQIATVLLICTSCTSPSRKASPTAEPATRPNFILIMTDDQGWLDAGFNGNQTIGTPNLDLLASRGIVLNRFYSASAVCSPTRASVITGRNPLRMEIPNANSGHMKCEEITLPELLHEAGYATGHFGKWHLGTLTKQSNDANRGGRDEHAAHFSIPTMHGYDEFFCTESKVPTFDPMSMPVAFEGDESLRFGWKALSKDMAVAPYGTAYWSGHELKEKWNLEGDDSRVIMDRVIPFVERSVNNSQPFFTTIWFHTPHLPVVADSIHRSPYSSLSLKEQLYFGTITALDEQIGRLWASLEELSVSEETMIWFCSDNGPENNTPGSTGIFRERKRSLYEGGVRVPAFVVWKGHLKEGIRMEFPALTSDYLPTIIDMLDLEYPDERPLDGRSILKLLLGEEVQRNHEFGFIYKKQISWVGDRYKLISINMGASYELYDLIEDPGEKDDLIDTEADIALRMKADLTAWLKSVEMSKDGNDY
jgi:arylsulfatase A-like enzyme